MTKGMQKAALIEGFVLLIPKQPTSSLQGWDQIGQGSTQSHPKEFNDMMSSKLSQAEASPGHRDYDAEYTDL